MSRYEAGFGPLNSMALPSPVRAYPQQDGAASTGEEYTLNDRGLEPRRAGKTATDQSLLHHHTAHHSIPRKPVGGVETLNENPTWSGQYERLDQKQPPINHKRTGSFFLIWWREVLCCVLFTGSLVAVVVTINPYEGRPLPQWPYNLSINSLIAIYMVILKAAMLLVVAQGLGQLKWLWFNRQRPLKDLLTFDEASRGPWGSLILLWRIRGRQVISSCGALITVAALAIDPFAQQVIARYDCRLPVTSALASIPKTNSYFVSGSGPHTGAGTSPISLGMQNYINAGIFNPGTPVSYVCSTGNCTFPKTYHSVGYWGACVDATSDLLVHSQNNSEHTYLPLYKLTLPSANPTYAAVENVSAVLNGTIAGGGWSDYLKLGLLDSTVGVILAESSANQISASCSKICDVPENHSAQNCIAKWSDIKWGCAGRPNTPKGYATYPYVLGAARCSMSLVVRTYKAVVIDGRWEETLLSVATEWGNTNMADNGPGYGMVNVECLNATDRHSLLEAGYQFEGKSWIPYNLSIDSSGTYYSINAANVTQGVVSPECIYQAGVISTESISSFLSSFLNGSVSPNYYSYDVTTSPMQLQAIYNGGALTFQDLNQTWRNLSDSITNNIRQNGDGNLSAPVLGQAWRDQTCVHIQWAFLAYPAALVVLAILFFVCMIFETGQGDKGIRDWKSSSLALLFHGLDRDAVAQRDRAGLVRAGEMEDAAESMFVRLGRTDDGWGFLLTPDGPERGS